MSQSISKAALGALPQIDYVQALRCHDGRWRLMLMHGADIVAGPLEGEIGDSDSVHLAFEAAAKIINAQEGCTRQTTVRNSHGGAGDIAR